LNSGREDPVAYMIAFNIPWMKMENGRSRD